MIKRVIGAVKQGRGTVHEQLGDLLVRYAAPEQGGDDAAHQVAELSGTLSGCGGSSQHRERS